MINKRLVSYLKEDKKYIYLQVLMQWLGLICQIIIIAITASMINDIYQKNVISSLELKIVTIFVLIIIKRIFTKQTAIL